MLRDTITDRRNSKTASDDVYLGAASGHIATRVDQDHQLVDLFTVKR